MSSNQGILPQYINPQHTEKVYQEHQFEQCYATSRNSNGLPSPCLTTPSSFTRGLTIDISDESTSTTDTSPASSMASSGYITPSSLSNASSRRHSLIVPEGQQCYLGSAYQNQTSPTPSPRRSSIRNHVEQLNSPVSAFFPSYSESLDSTPRSLENGSFHSAVSSEEMMMGVEVYQNKSHNIDWQGAIAANAHGSTFDQGAQMPVQFLSVDLAAGFNASLASAHMDLPRQALDQSPLSNFNSLKSRERCIIPSQVQYSQLPTLAEPFEPVSHFSDRSTPPLSPSTSSPRHRRRSGMSSSRRQKLSKPYEPPWRVACYSSSKSHKCDHCEDSFKRPEHLKRHEKKHIPEEEALMLACCFPECTRKIKDRSDNMRAHLQVTHFKYGKSERGGKNSRFSMKKSMEMSLRSEDVRWTLLLDGDIVFGDTETKYYKMLGYSIKETQDIKVKELIPEWEGPDETTFKKFDPRWNKLLEGTMTFEQAMETGRGMPETEKEGILGVDMLTSKDMGLQELDPRWKKLLDGSMSVEISEKLGVKHLNPSVVEKQKA